MRKKLTIVTILISALFYLSLSSFAEQKATKKECIAKCKAAVAMVKKKGLKKTLKVLQKKNGPFVWKNSYVFSINIDTKNVIAHAIKPKLIGKNLVHIKDIKGKMFFAEFINIAKAKGNGWVDYMWPKPGEKKPSQKITYVLKVPGKPILMAAGIYK